MKTFKFHRLAYTTRRGRRVIAVDLLADDNLTGISFSSCSVLSGDWCQVWSENGVLWAKDFRKAFGGSDGLTGLKRLIAACLPELMMLGYIPIGSFEYGDETVQINPHDAPIEAVQLPDL